MYTYVDDMFKIKYLEMTTKLKSVKIDLKDLIMTYKGIN